MIRIEVENETEFKAVELVMDLPPCAIFEYHLSYGNPIDAPEGKPLATGRTYVREVTNDDDPAPRSPCV